MLGFYVFKYSLYAIIYCGIILAGIINCKIIETFLLFVSFVALRYCFPKTFHAKNVYNCVFLSIFIFVVAIPNTNYIGSSLFSSIIIGFVMTYVLYLVEDYCDLMIFYHKHNDFSLDNATEEQITECCKLLHYRQEKIKLAKMFFVERLSNEQVWNYLLRNNKLIDLDTVRQYKYRMARDLKKFVQE